jgi:hypothetical protein
MTLKRSIKALEDAPEAVRSFYKQVGEEFILQVDGHSAETPESVTALKNAKDHEKNLRVAAENERDQAKTALTEAEEARTTAETERDAAKASKGQDVQALEASWKQKLEDATAAAEKDKNELTGEIERLLKTNTAQSLANEISTVPELFAGVIEQRLKVEKGADGKFFTRVLDGEGKPSAGTIDDLRKELLANDKYAAIIISGKGSGGGAGGTGSGGGASEKKWLDHTDQELIELRRTDPDKYERLKAAHKTPEPAPAS